MFCRLGSSDDPVRTPADDGWIAGVLVQRVIVGVPIDSLGRPGGTELAPGALRSTGIAGAVGAIDVGDLDVRIVGADRDPSTKIVGYETVLAAVRGVRDGLAPHLAAGRFPVVLGGCCTLIPGAVAAACIATQEPVGLVTIDGHLDLYDANTSPTGEAADLPVALCIGHGDPYLVAVGPSTPLVEASHVALLAHRDSDEANGLGSLMPDEAGIDLSIDDVAIRNLGAATVGVETAAQLTLRVSRYWLAIDVDALADDAFPATPYHQPGGITVDEIVELATPLAQDPGCVGLSIACYDPGMDTPTMTGAHDVAAMLTRVLAARPGL
jgi:arginase